MNVKSISSGGVKYFVLVEGGDESKQKIKLVQVTDGLQAWELQDVEFKEQLNIDSLEWWSAIKAAVKDDNTDKLKHIQINQQAAELVIEWSWLKNADEELRDRLVLQTCQSQHIVIRMLDVLLNSFTVVQEIQGRVDTELVQSKEMAAKLQQSEREKQEMYERFAIVLNEKKRQVRYFAEKAGMIDDKGVYQIQQHEMEQIPMISDGKSKSGTMNDDKSEEEDTREGGESPIRELYDVEDILNADTQPIADQQDVAVQQVQEEPIPDEKIVPIVKKVVKKSNNKRGRRR
eukprot:TRINITY_DN21832_c0_g1_i1.p1 TRINITY_DN21832_c0_g1~~TRINITY_DN21832_c0_g1_i1.p1  ORF type:complete len:289 (-),score=68.91 TRINITY_DN21832_c0_g1_i1:701-1567(-)